MVKMIKSLRAVKEKKTQITKNLIIIPKFRWILTTLVFKTSNPRV